MSMIVDIFKIADDGDWAVFSYASYNQDKPGAVLVDIRSKSLERIVRSGAGDDEDHYQAAVRKISTALRNEEALPEKLTFAS